MQDVWPGYLRMVGIRLEAGRDFTMDDVTAARKVAIVDHRVARELWPGGAIGQTLIVGPGQKPRVYEVVGVTNPVRTTEVRDATIPHLFFPSMEWDLNTALVIDTAESAAALGPAIKQTVESLGTRRPVFDIRPLRFYVDRSTAETRFTMGVIVAFAAAALFLAAVGIYGTLAYLASLRRHEFAVRLALGATTGRVLRAVVGEGLVLTIAGALIGLAGAVVVASSLRDLLYDVSAFDVPTLATVMAVVAFAALAATTLPALRAARTDPAVVLRAE